MPTPEQSNESPPEQPKSKAAKHHPTASHSLKEARGNLRKLSQGMLKNLMADGKISFDELEELKRLDQLLNIYNATRPKRKIRLIIVGLLVGVISVVSILLFTNVRSTRIELDIETTNVEFQAAQDDNYSRTLFSLLRADELGLSSIEKLEIPLKKESLYYFWNKN